MRHGLEKIRAVFLGKRSGSCTDMLGFRKLFGSFSLHVLYGAVSTERITVRKLKSGSGHDVSLGFDCDNNSEVVGTVFSPRAASVIRSESMVMATSGHNGSTN